MKRPLTDHEYQINGGAWNVCTSANTTNNGDGTYTITNGLDVGIPIGSLKVRVKSLGINPASAALLNTVAFTATVRPGVAPYFYLTPVSTMAIGDPDQLLGYVSNSAGAVSFISSDPTKATIVTSGGNSYLHIVAPGSITVTANQVASIGYLSATSTDNVYLVAATTVDDAIYTNIATGRAATSNGSSFNVQNANSLTLKNYLMVADKAVYQKTIPAVALKTVKAVQAKIYDQSLGVMPGSPIIDIDSSFAAFNRNRFRNVGNMDTFDSNIIRFNKPDVYASTVTKLNDNEWKVVFPAGVSPSIVGPLFGKYVPAGVWTFSMDVRLPSGAPTRSVKYGPTYDSAETGYLTVVLTETYQTIQWPSIESDTDSIDPYRCVLSGVDGNPAANTIIISNFRLTPGTTASVPSDVIQLNPTLYDGQDNIGQALQSDLSFKFSDGITAGNALIHRPTAALNLSSMSASFAIKSGPPTGGTYNVFMSNDAGQVMYPDETHYMFDAFFGQVAYANPSHKFDDNRWNIVTFTANNTEQLLYLNGYQIARRAGTNGPTTFNLVVILGMITLSVQAFGFMSAVAIWGSKLSDSDVLSATNLIKKRMKLKNHFLDQHRYFYIAEGDSITAKPLSYARTLRDAYILQTPGSNAATPGTTLGDNLSPVDSNSLYGRMAWINARIVEQVAVGKTVVMTVLIGANDIQSLTTSGAVVTYYNNLMAYIAVARTSGAKVAASTVLDMGTSLLPDKTYLIQLNDLIRADATKYDALIDYYADPAFATASITYYDNDGLLHPNTTGYTKMFDIAKPIMDALRLINT